MELKTSRQTHLMTTVTFKSVQQGIISIKESYSRLVNALYTIAVLKWTNICHKATLSLHVGNMLPVSSNHCTAVNGFTVIVMTPVAGVTTHLLIN